MNKKFIVMLEKYFSNELSQEEEIEFFSLVEKCPTLKKEFEEQKQIREILNKMEIKNPDKNAWDGYWLSIYNKIERGIAWILISLASIAILFYGALKALNNFLKNHQMPVTIKYAYFILILGIVILIVSVVREKIFTYKRDKYKEIQR